MAVGFVALVAALTFESVHGVPGNSDGATVVLQGKAMASGNVLLHGWRLSLDSFWTLDAALYALVALVIGARPVLLNLVPALIAGGTVVLAVALATQRRRALPALAGAVTVVVLLALPSHAMATTFLQGPLHVGTTLCCLGAFVLLGRRGRWAWCGAAVLFAAGLLGDMQIVALGIGPAVLAGGMSMARSRSWRAGAPALFAVGGGVLLAVVVHVVADALHGFRVVPGAPLAPASRWPANVALVPTDLAHLLGVGGGPLGAGGMPGALECLRVVGLVALAAGVAWGAWRVLGHRAAGEIRRPAAVGIPVEDLLVPGVVGALVVFVLLTLDADPGYYRELTAVVVYGAVLAGRMVATIVDRLDHAPRRDRLGGTAIGLLGVAAFLASTLTTVLPAVPRQPAASLGRFLESHHLHDGIGDYWSASITTVETGGAVQVRPVEISPQGKLVAYARQGSADWYDGRFQFLAYLLGPTTFGISSDSAQANLGPASRTYVVGPYVVLVWARPVAVPLGPPTSRP